MQHAASDFITIRAPHCVPMAHAMYTRCCMLIRSRPRLAANRGTAAMVSQSRDGDFVAIGLRLAGIKTIRGSSRRRGQDKGGLSALSNLIEHVRTGYPAYLAVDGPRGPRNRVHKGIAVLSQQTGAAVLNVVAVPTRRWIFKRSWDRFQIPKPFCRIDIFVAPPIWPQQGESIERI